MTEQDKKDQASGKVVFSYDDSASQDVYKRQLLKWSLLVCLAVEALIQLIIWTSTDMLISIFNSENNVQLLNYAHTGLRLYFLGFIVAGINVVPVSYTHLLRITSISSVSR